MREWQVQTARSRFSELFDAALGEGPQRVTRHGRQAVVVVSEDEWKRRAPPSEDEAWARHLASFPLEPGELPRWRRKPPRAVRKPPFG